MACISAPATARLAPTKTPINVRGRRRVEMMSCSFEPSHTKRYFNESMMPMSEAPTERFSPSPNIKMISAMMNIISLDDERRLAE